MQPNKHPEYTPVTVTCGCGQQYKTRSARTENFTVDVCSACHPYFTGKQKLLDTAGRVERFRTKYKAQDEAKAKAAAAKPAAEAKPAEEKKAEKPAKKAPKAEA